MPLALAGVMPWWTTLLLCLLYGLGVRSSGWAEGRLLASLFLAGLSLVPSVLAGLNDHSAQALSLFSGLGLRHIALLLGVLLLHGAALLLEGGSRKGLLVVLFTGLFAPQPGLLLALAGAALARHTRDDQATHLNVRFLRGQQGQRRFWQVTLLVLGLTSLVGLALPRYAPTVTLASLQAPNKVVPPPPSYEPSVTSLQGHSQPQPPIRRSSPATFVPVPPIEWTLIPGLALLLALLVAALRFKTTAPLKGPSSLLWVLLLLAFTVNYGLILLLAPREGSAFLPQLLGGGGPLPQGAGGPGGLAGGGGPLASILSVIYLLIWAAMAFQLLFTVLFIWLLFRRQTDQASVPTAREQDTQDSEAPGPERPLHRVRVAYQQAEEALAAHGWARLSAETPLSYAQRLERLRPAFGPPSLRLAGLYGPVRYGGVVSEQEAAQAEQAARELSDLAAKFPNQPEPDELARNEDTA